MSAMSEIANTEVFETAIFITRASKLFAAKAVNAASVDQKHVQFLHLVLLRNRPQSWPLFMSSSTISTRINTPHK